ncbi:MAG: DUF1800 family protein [Planctomycetota bacterium]
MLTHALGLLVLSTAPPALPCAAPSAVSAVEGDVRLDLERTTLWVGRGAVLGFGCDEAQERREIEVTTSDSAVVEVLGAAEVLPGASTGTFRVRGVAPGSAVLRIGPAELPVEVRPLTESARAWRLEPSIVTPVLGAMGSGTISVGVEVTRADLRDDVQIELRLPDGRAIAATEPFAQGGGPCLRRRFDLDVEFLEEGEHTLRAVVLVDGEEVGSSEETIEVARAGAASIRGECEDGLDEERPEEFGRRAPRVGGGTDASGGAFVVLPRNDFVFVTPFEVVRTGRHQLYVRARGDLAGGAFPSIAASFDAPTPYSGTTRLVDHRWQRLPVGAPVDLYEGEHHLALRLLNDLDVGDRADRDLYVDEWELIHVEDDDAAAGASMMMMDDGAGPRGPRGAGLWIGLERPFDRHQMSGRMWIRGAANWSGGVDSAAPTVELVVNGEVRATQQTAKPAFALDRAHLGEGVHRIELRASLPDGRTATTPAQRLTVVGPVAEVEPRDLVRFDVLDERWDGGFVPYLDGQNEEVRQRVVRPRREVESILQVPADLAGTWEVALEARAGGGDRPGRAAIALVMDGERSEELTTRVTDWWSLRSFGTVTVPEGGASVALRLSPQDENPELRVRSLVFRKRPGVPDRTPPSARLAYPADGATLHGVDMAVVEAFDDDAIESVDVLLDGRAQGTFGHVPGGSGAITAPILLRDVAAGAHALALRVQDRAGNVAQTEPITVHVVAEAPAERGPYARSVHLANRIGLGPDPLTIAEILTKGESAWLADALQDESSGHDAARGMADVRAGDRIVYDADRQVLTYALRTSNPVRTRFTLWVDNHFSTWGGKTGTPSEWAEHREFARMGWAPFGELLRASATSGVMLVYLDQDQSYAGRINENYARELLELHTVGVDGGYDQEDVTELARLLAGLTVSQEAPADGSGVYQRRHFRFDPELSDGRACTLFGREYVRTPPAQRFDRFVETLELLERRPETARFVSRKLAEHYVSVPAPDTLVDDLAGVFQTSGGDPRAVLTALVAHPEFWDGADAPRLTSPLDYGLRIGRICRIPAVDWSLRQFLQNSGMGLFDRVSPDGYPEEDTAWADTNGLMQRWRWVQQIPWAVRNIVPNDNRRYSGGDPDAWRQRILDHAAVRLTGWTLGEESNAAALAFFQEDEAQVWRQVDNACELVCRLPEANLK